MTTTSPLVLQEDRSSPPDWGRVCRSPAFWVWCEWWPSSSDHGQAFHSPSSSSTARVPILPESASPLDHPDCSGSWALLLGGVFLLQSFLAAPAIAGCVKSHLPQCRAGQETSTCDGRKTRPA